MANLARIAAPDFDSSNPATTNKITGMLAGELLAKGDAVYMKSDGRWWKATGAAADALAKMKGLAGTAASAGEAVTVVGPGWRWKYGAGLTPGAQYFLGTAGLLGDAATTGGTSVVAVAVSDTDILLTGVQN